MSTISAAPADDDPNKRAADTRSAQNAYHKAKSQADRDIAPGYPGEPKDLKRREACEHDLERYLRTYFPRVFRGPFCAGHRKLIGKTEEAEHDGGLFCQLFFRGGGKTSIFLRAMLHATTYRLRRFGVIISATNRDATRIMRHQKAELWTNELLLADFPECTYAFARLEDNGRRCKGQLWMGQPTHIEWTPDQIVFARIPELAPDPAIIATRAITGAIKGLNYRAPDGTSLRPDFVLLDDVQTRRSAKSLTATEDRMQTIDGDVLGLAGHDAPITAVQAITPIYAGDLACIYASRELKPDWQADTVPMVLKLPDALDTLWEQYRQIADDARKNDGDKQAATRFYAEHQEAMDAGAVLTWPDGPTSGRLSVLQYAMDLYFRSRQAFHAEFQCRPLSTTVAPGLMLPADEIARRVSGLAQGIVPPWADHLTAFVDPGKAYLFYMVCAWAKDFTGSVIEYGAFPQQRRRYFSKGDANPTIASYFAEKRPALAGASEETLLAAALDELLPDLHGRVYANADGDAFALKRILCDSGDLGEIVCAAIRRVNLAKEKLPPIMPSFGVGIGARNKPFSAFVPKPGDVVGWHWRAEEPKDRNHLREVRIDTNAFKSFIHKRFFVDRLLPGSLTLYGDKRTDHALIADHLTAETPKEMENKSDDRRVTEWTQTPGRENEGLDCLVGCAVGAAMSGSELAGAQEPPPRSGRKRRPIGELMQQNS